MSRVLTGKVRRVGNSMAVIIPKELLEESGASEGDTIKLSLTIPKSMRQRKLESIAGLDRKARPFAREKRDRFQLLLDTSAIIEVLRHPKTSNEFRLIQKHVGAEELYVLIVQLAELSDWCIANNAPVRERIEEVKKLANIIPLDEDICLEGSRLKNERRRKGFESFGLLDGLLLAAARSMDERVLTFDRDFAEEEDCILVPFSPVRPLKETRGFVKGVSSNGIRDEDEGEER